MTTPKELTSINDLLREANKLSDLADRCAGAGSHELSIALNKRAMALYTRVEKLSTDLDPWGAPQRSSTARCRLQSPPSSSARLPRFSSTAVGFSNESTGGEGDECAYTKSVVGMRDDNEHRTRFRWRVRRASVVGPRREAKTAPDVSVHATNRT
jgi:hypothetical protein